MTLPFDLTTGQGAFLAAALFVAAFIRGVSGFGFSAIFIILAALVTNPVPLIPIVFSCEILMTVFQARGIRGHIDWRRVLALLVGAGITIVPSVAIMATLDAATARMAISALILVLSVVLLSGWQMSHPIGPIGTTGVGMISGIANSAGVGGLPVAAFLTAQPIPPVVFRATMIVFLTGLDMLAMPVMAAHGLVTGDTVWGILMAFPILGAGIWVGSKQFERLPQHLFRQMVIGLMALMAVLNIARVI
jgi:uncharacterized membrane protein YfcA